MAFVNRSRKSGFVLRSGGPKRETAWIAASVTNTALAGPSGASLILVGNAALLALTPFTIVRTRGLLNIRSDQSAASETFHVGLGWFVPTVQATAIGVTAVPTPMTDDGSDMFFVYEEASGRFDFTTGTGYRLVDVSRYYDSKAMRKVNDDQDIAVTIETSASSAGATVLHHARFLIKLN